MPHKLARGLYGLVDDSLWPAGALLQVAEALIAERVPMVQLRLKTLGDRQALELIKAVCARERTTAVLVDDRVDLAMVGGADGVHLGQSDLPIEVARSLLGPKALIGATCRSLAEVERAKALGADHVGVGPVFRTSTKQVAHPLLGLEGLRAVVAGPLPVVAIAGISLANIESVAQTGACAAAVGSSLKPSEGETIGQRALALMAAFERGLSRASPQPRAI